MSVLAPDSLKLTSARQVKRPCAVAIQRTSMGNVQLADGRAFQEIYGTPDYKARDTSAFEDAYDRRTEVERTRPRLEGTPLLSSDRVNSRRVGGDYVGIWKVRKRWLVQSFSLLADGTFTQPRAILSSSLPLRSVMYFPGPDSPSGRLEVIQAQPNGSVFMLGFDWWHASAFERR